MALAKFTIEMAADLGQLKRDVASMQEVMSALGQKVAAGYLPVVQATRNMGDAHTKAAGQAIMAAQAQQKSANLVRHQNIQLANQVQDFGIQVAGGQSPLLALAQQGSQLFAVYGGLRPALSAVTGLFTAQRVVMGGVAAGVGLLAGAWVTAQNQNAEFRRSMSLTNGAAGLTANAFAEMVNRIGQATGKGAGYVREMAQALVSSGRFGPAQIEQVTQGAVLMASITGKSAQEISQEWVRMSESPAAYAREVNKSLNVLTTAELAYITQLEKNGQRQQAAQLVSQTLMGVYTREVAADLGTLQSIAAATGRIFDDTWASVAGWWGRSASDQRIKDLQDMLNFEQTHSGNTNSAGYKKMEAELDALLSRRKAKEKEVADVAASVAAERAAADKAAADEAAKGEREAAARAAAAEARAAAAAASRMASAREALTLAKGELVTRELTLSTDAQLALLQQRRAFGIDNTAEERALTARAIAGLELRKIDAEGVRLASELAAVRQRANTTTTEGLQAQTQVVQLQSRQLELDAQRGQVVRQLATDINGINVAEQQSAQRFAEKVASMREVTAGYQQQLELQGMTQLAAERLTEVRKIEAGYQRELLELSRDLTLSEEERAARGRSLATEREAQLNAYAQLHAARYREIYDAETGVNSAIREYLDNVAQAGKQAKDATANVMKSMEDQIVQFAKTGKVQVRDLADAVIEEFVRIKVAQPLVSALFSAFSPQPPTVTTPVTTTGPGFKPTDYNLSSGGGIGLKLNALGGAYVASGAVERFAKGGTFTNNVVSSPTMFKFANGGKFGLMGEAGPEAVMPLQRDSRGRLGVIANLASKGGTAPQVNLKVNVINEGGAGLQVTSQRTTQGADGQLSVDVMVRQVQDALADNVAAGSGSLYHAMGSRFAKQGVM